MNILLFRWAPIVAGFSVFISAVFRVLFFYNSPDAELIGVIPDDAFYYIQMARHRASEGIWTFDGITVTTGFHFLYGYILVFIYSVFGDVDWRHLFLIIGGLASIFMGVSAYFTARIAENFFGKSSILLVLSPFFTFTALMQSTAMMESWLVLFFSASSLYFSTQDKDFSILSAIGLCSLGIFGSLSRSDFGLLAGVVFAAYLISFPWFKTKSLKRSAIVLVGAVVGVCIILLQNFYISGHFSQGSAQVKLYWSSLGGHSVLPIILLIGSMFLPFFSILNKSIQILLLLSFPALVVYSSYKFIKSKNRFSYTPSLILAFSCFFTIIGYVFFYRYNSRGINVWYSSNLIVPIGIVLAALGNFLFRKRLLIPAVLILSGYLYVGKTKFLSSRWPHQIGMLKAGLFLKEKKFAKVGAWNAGIISYFSKASVVNIDGLANDGVFSFVKGNTLFDYLKSNKIDYLIDYEEMLKNEEYQKRGGYFDKRIDRCLRSVYSVDAGSPKWNGSELKLFKFIPNCK
ncbi:hypothetical protein CH352_18080 [Leptospira hartskeerlii]|uniref:Glycosyltransferase RgtA/B/C/D-like domain-containing protein n=1 Tax=Leptospira hartskeerlii TaxID=2023177 RepID=A0A2M9X8S8_9LEPT|nr:hypothetical protein [Leptospira hartskeerlii]PJZ24065.1 hypothetical protein CH357_18230 [Leptospira hartskeerlii]PJZ32131.1 hypothetical protein CH352_18080 [Leptospira hartskeerlii]